MTFYHRNAVCLPLDQDAAEFYIGMLEDYYARTGDVGVRDDLRYLRSEVEKMWGEEDDGF